MILSAGQCGYCALSCIPLETHPTSSEMAENLKKSEFTSYSLHFIYRWCRIRRKKDGMHFMKKILIGMVALFLLSACGKEKLTPQTVTFTLDSNPTTGYRWQVEQSEELFNVITSFSVSEAEKPVTGAGGVETITLEPLKAGETEVTLTYARPWENGGQTDQLVYTFEIDKNLQVTMSNAYSLSANSIIPTPEPVIK